MRMLRNKKGFELAIGFIVILVITIVIFASSIVIVRKMFVQTQNIKESLSTQAQRDIERLLTQGRQVALVPSSVETRGGLRTPIGVGVMNIMAVKQDFFIATAFSNAFDPNSKVIQVDRQIADKWLLLSPNKVPLEHGERTTRQVLVAPTFDIIDGVRTPKGTYVFNVCVLTCESPTKQQRRPQCTSQQQAKRACRDARQAPGTLGDDLYTQKVYKLKVNIE